MPIYYDISSVSYIKNPVITIGTFDGVHQGHKTILNEVIKHAKAINGESMLLTFEPHPRKLIFPEQPLKLLTPLKDKLQLIQEAGIRHTLVVPFTRDFSNLSSEDYIKDFLVNTFHPHTIVIGYDHRFGHDREGDINMLKKYADAYNYEVYEISAKLIDEAVVSSTKIRKALQEGHVTEASHMLGRSYSLRGTVVKGAQIGRTIGFPTANVLPENSEQIIPGNSVYAIQAEVNGQRYNAMLNIGYRPTVSNELQLHIEANIFDFSGDIYGQQITLIFIEKLRNEQKFPSLDALKEQLGKDKQQTMQILQAI
jgi:riboflavin kinase/FMN adenylyltransferase